MTTVRQRLQQTLAQSPLSDMYVTGFVDTSDGTYELTAFGDHVYLEFGDGLIELRAMDQGEYLQICFRSELATPYELEDDCHACHFSIAPILLLDPLADNTIVSCSMFGADTDGQHLRCRALRLRTVGGQVLFFDPSFVHGIGLGGPDQESVWRENLPDGETVEEDIITPGATEH